LAEDKRRHDEQRRKEEQKHAQEALRKEMIDGQRDLDSSRPQKKSMKRCLIGEEYEHDNEYFDIQKKIWEKQLVRHCY
ncbi:unnamed protein product, partial [Didymodactylos carnosus]